jgi:hypothetical protein
VIQNGSFEVKLGHINAGTRVKRSKIDREKSENAMSIWFSPAL